MHLDATIELLQATIRDINRTVKNYSFTRVYADLVHATTSLEEAVMCLKWAKKHKKELEN